MTIPFGIGAPIWWVIAGGLFLWMTRKSIFLNGYLRSVWLALRLPGPFAWPLIGNADWTVNSKKLVWAASELPRKYGLMIRAWLSIYPVVFVIDPNHIHKILSNGKHIEKTSLYKMMHNFLGTGLITSDGPRWKMHRRLMQPFFNLSYLEAFVEVFERGADLLISSLQEQIDMGKPEINITSLVNKAVFRVLTEAILGEPVDSYVATTYEVESPYRQGSSALLYRLLRPWLLIPSVFNVTSVALAELKQKQALFEFTKKAIERRKQKVTSLEEDTQKCFLDHLIGISAANPHLFTEDDCAHEACTLMLAGQDSVGAALAFTMHLLATHPENQEKVAIEQESIFESSSGRATTLKDLQRMMVLEQCIKESLRLYPSVPVFARTLGDDLSLGKWTLPKGCDVYIAPYATHRLPEIYTDPETFKPERFEEGTGVKRPPCSYLPFSVGHRNCIGYKFAELEMKTILSAVLRRFLLSPVKGKETVTPTYRLTLRAAGGLWVRFTPRKSIT